MLDFVTDEDVLNNISDDIIYLREMIKKEKEYGLNRLKESHLGRIVVVVVYNCMESYKDFLVRKYKIHNKYSDWKTFLYNSKFSYPIEEAVKEKSIKLSSVDELYSKLSGLGVLRDFISHGLVDISARNFNKKMEILKKANLIINPKNLTINDVENILELDETVTTLFTFAKIVIDKV